MDGFLKQSTAITFRIGPFLDDSDGKTAKTTLSIGQADVKLSKAGGAFAQKSDTSSCTHDTMGYYSCSLNTTDTGTLGMLKLAVHVTGALPVWHTFMVLPANVYDSLVAGTAKLDTNVTHVAGTAQTANDMSGDVDTILSRVIGTIASGTHYPQSGDCYARLGAPAGASVSADIASVKSDTVAILDDTGTSGVVIPQDQANKVWNSPTRSLTDKAGFTISGTKTTLDALNDITAASVWTVANRSLTDKSDFALSSASRAAIWDEIGSLSLSFEVLVERIYQILNNKMVITESSGDVALRNLADSANIATGNVQDLGTTTQRNALSWV